MPLSLVCRVGGHGVGDTAHSAVVAAVSGTPVDVDAHLGGEGVVSR